jgi:hypothetical protein
MSGDLQLASLWDAVVAAEQGVRAWALTHQSRGLVKRLGALWCTWPACGGRNAPSRESSRDASAAPRGGSVLPRYGNCVGATSPRVVAARAVLAGAASGPRAALRGRWRLLRVAIE